MFVSGYAAVYEVPGLDRMCFGYGDTLAECKAMAQSWLQVPDNQIGCRIYGQLIWEELTADQASEVSAMLDADWVFRGSV